MQRNAGSRPFLRELCVGFALFLLVGCANKQQVAREQMTDLQRLALSDVRSARPAEARKRLLASARVGREAELVGDPLMVRNQMLLGALYAQAMKDDRRAIAYMYQALRADPAAKLPAALSGPQARRALISARARLAGRPIVRDSASASLRAAATATPARAGGRVAAPPAGATTANNRLPPRAAREVPPPPNLRAARPPVDDLPPEADAAPPRGRVAAGAPTRATNRAPGRPPGLVPERGPEPARAPAPDPEPEPVAPPIAAARRAPPPPVEEPMAPPVPAPRRVPASAPPSPSEGAPPPVAAAGPPPRAGVTAFPAGHADPVYCPVPMEAPPQRALILRCAVRPDLRPSGLTLHYRPSGSETFTSVPMPRTRTGVFRGVVPVEATSGKSLQFFVDAGTGAKINSGSADSPNILLLRAGATPLGQRAADDGDDARDGEDEAAALAERIRREDEDPLAASDLRRELAQVRRRPGGKFWVAVGVGTGYGVQPGRQLEFRQNRRVDAGPLSAGLVHALPEIGYQVTDNFSLSVQGRFQYSPVDGSGDPLPGNPRQSAMAFLLRGVLNLGEGPLHAFLSGCVGGAPGGGFRLIVPADSAAEMPRSDTVRGGPVVVGAGTGLVYHLSRSFAFPLEIRTLVGFPSVAAVLEAGTGVVFAF